jgi:transcriptional regulator of nitric oxide reductase
VVFHAEPHVQDDPQRQKELDTFLAAQAGRALRNGKDTLTPDYVADSTVSARAMRTAVLATASLVLRPRLRRGGGAAVASAVPVGDADTFQIKTLEQLVADGAVARKRVMSGEVKEALAKENAADAKLDWPLGHDDELYIEFVTALLTPEPIGGNLLGVVKLEEYKNDLPKGAQAIYVASSGPYDFIGPSLSKDHRFDRFRVVQDGKTFTFREADYTYAVPTGGMQLAGLFMLRANSGFDGTKPWRLELLVKGAGAKPVTVAFGADYKLPDLSKPAATTTAAAAPSAAADAAGPDAQGEDALDDAAFDAPPPVPAYVEAWEAAKGKAVGLALLLTTLTLIFVFQAQLARHRLAHRWVRNGFLLRLWCGSAGSRVCSSRR